MKSNLNAFITNNDKLKPYLAHCYKEKIKIFPPSINKSEDYFKVEGEEEGIRFGLKALASINVLSGLILEERKLRGLFSSFEDFVKRMTINQKLNKAQIETLIYSGALDEFDGSRRGKLSIVDLLINRAKIDKKDINSGQLSIFDIAVKEKDEVLEKLAVMETPKMKEFDIDYLLEKEKTSAGIYITAHPLDFYENQLKRRDIKDMSLLKDSVISSEDGIVKESYISKKVSVAGIITEVNHRYTSKNDMFITFKMEDRTSEMGLVCFTKNLDKNRNHIFVGKKVIATGKFSVNDFGPQIIVDTVVDLENYRDVSEKVYIYVSEDSEMANNEFKKISNYLINHKNINGETTVIFVNRNKRALLKFKVDLNLDTLAFMQNTVGFDNISFDELKSVS